MKIGIDISQSAYKGTGVGRYTVQLVQSLLAHPSKHEYIFLFSSMRNTPPDDIAKLVKPPHKLIQFRFPPSALSFLWNTLHVVPVERLIGNVDVFISSDWTQPPLAHAKSITVIHDLVMYAFPESLPSSTTFLLRSATLQPNIVTTHKRRLAHVEKEVDTIVADSHSTKSDIEKYLHISSDRIVVIYPPVSIPKISQHERDKVMKRFHLQRPFILSVGKIEPRKNIARLIEGYSAHSLFKQADLIIVGPKGWGDQTFDIPDAARSAITFTGYVTDAELHALYSRANVFAYPSLYEGFGYPIIEAMLHKCPVVTSRMSSLEELGTDHAVLIDPTRAHDIGAAIKDIIENPGAYSRNVEKAHSFALKMNEDRFAKEMLQVINSVHAHV